MPNMAVTSIANIGIAVFTANPPSNEEWEHMLDVMRKADYTRFRGISFSDGGAPTTTQRKKMHEVTGGRSVPSVVITASSFTRAVVTAMSWFNPSIRAYSPEQLDEALHHLNVGAAEFGLIKLEVRKLAAKLGPPPLACIPLDL
jgi:hypothetical protein